ncbi:hypothetical protein ACIQUS_24480 [Pseudomonas sp. NPDC090755]|uniref:hypothetical protein n=1 Tax=Pseudomonas sp. NPDC090755 TaxID=3364481 RepID=UPI00383A569A
MSGFWSSWWAFAFMLAPFVISLSGVAMTIYIAHSRNFEVMIANLQNSLWVTQQVPIFGTSSLKSRCYLLGTISGAMLYPRISVRLGAFDEEDLRNFPIDLRRRLLVAAWLVIIGSAWLFIGLGLIKLFAE